MTSVFGDGGVSLAQVADVLHPGYAPASFGMMYEGATTSTVAMQAADIVFLYPFRVYRPITVTSLYQRCETAGAGSAVKTAIWANNYKTARPTGLPLFGQNTGFDTSTTGTKTAVVASVLLPSAVYWGGTKATGTMPTMTNVNSTSGASNLSLPTAQMGGGTAPVGFSVPDAYANDIVALDMTGATFTVIAAGRIPVVGLGWA
jgi:hypothetical protein